MTLIIAEHEVEFSAIRAQGAGGQNVNKVSSAIHLRFDIVASSIPEHHKQRLLQLKDQRITAEGVIVIKSQEYRSQEKNKVAALERLHELIAAATKIDKPRKATRPTRGSQKRRLEGKAIRGEIKAGRGKISP